MMFSRHVYRSCIQLQGYFGRSTIFNIIQYNAPVRQLYSNRVPIGALLSRLCSTRSGTTTMARARKAKGPVSWKTLAVVGVVGGITVYITKMVASQKEKELNVIETIGKIQVGGPWEGLVDHTGKSVSSADFHGQWWLLYFGFTHCPDICPEEMEKIVKAVDIIDDNETVPNVLPVMISIDPARDSYQRVGEYVKEFSPKYLGLTGTVEKVAEVARLYRVYSSQGPRDNDDDYIVDHSIITYLINPYGEVQGFFTRNQNARQVASTTIMHMVTLAAKNKKQAA